MTSTNETVSPHEDVNTPDVCSICLEEMTKPCTMYAYMESCRHYFHDKCLFSWFYQQGEHSCPICRADFYRILVWPKAIKSQHEKKIIFELQKQCFGLFNILPEDDICVTHPRGNVNVLINDKLLQLKCPPNEKSSIYQPATELYSPDLGGLALQFRMEACDHTFPSDQLKSQLANLRQTGKVVCSACGIASLHLLLEPEFTRLQDEDKAELFFLQKKGFCKEVKNHNLVIEHVHDEVYSIRFQGRQHLLDTVTSTDIDTFNRIINQSVY